MRSRLLKLAYYSSTQLTLLLPAPAKLINGSITTIEIGLEEEGEFLNGVVELPTAPTYACSRARGNILILVVFDVHFSSTLIIIHPLTL